MMEPVLVLEPRTPAMVTKIRNMIKPKTKVAPDTIGVQQASLAGSAGEFAVSIFEFADPKVLLKKVFSFESYERPMIASSVSGTVISKKMSMARQKWYKFRFPILPSLQACGTTPNPLVSSPIILISKIGLN